MNENTESFYQIALTFLILVFVSVIISYLSGCEPAAVPTCHIPEPTIIENIIEKPVYITNITEKIVYKECNITEVSENLTNVEIYNLTLPFILRIKHLDKQLDECLFSNSSCHNKSLNYNYGVCVRQLNYTQRMVDDWIEYTRFK